MGIRLSLPLPPSGNHRNDVKVLKKPIRTKKGKLSQLHRATKAFTTDFRGHVALALKVAGVRPTTEPVAVELDVFPNREGRDMDNIEKTLWDALEGLVYDNDKRIRRKVVEMFPADKLPRVELSIEPYTQAGK
jgi:Holliday junction resolvase RusA-like endonuclease